MKTPLTSAEIRYRNARHLREQAGGVTEFARRMDREQPQMSSIVGDNPSKGIGNKLARLIESSFNKQPGWLDIPHPDLWGRSYELAVEERTPEYDAAGIHQETAAPTEPPGVPVVGSAQLGPEGYHIELEYPVGHGEGSVSWPSRDPNAYAVRCPGHSMEPRIRFGEFAVIEPNKTYSPGDEVLIRTMSGQVMIKIFLYKKDGFFYFESINKDFDKIVINEREIEVIHYLAGIAKAALFTPNLPS